MKLAAASSSSLALTALIAALPFAAAWAQVDVHQPPVDTSDPPLLSRYADSTGKAILYRSWEPATGAPVGTGPGAPAPAPADDWVESGDVARDQEYARVGLAQMVILEDPKTGPLRVMEDATMSPQPSVVRTPPIQGVDPMIAVGRDHYVASQNEKFGFFDRSGSFLKDGAGKDLLLQADDFFAGFVAAETADGLPNEENINLYLDFPEEDQHRCDPYAQPLSDFCIRDFYDVRCLYEPGLGRFVILAQARHGDSSISSKHPRFKHLSRRFLAVAVSKSEDPRDGFHQYMVTESNGRDFPWMAVSGDGLITAHAQAQTTTGPAVTVFHLPAMARGDRTVPRFSYSGQEVGATEATVLPALSYPGGGDVTWMIRRSKSGELEILAFDRPDEPWKRPPLLKTTVSMTPDLGAIAENLTYRHGRLHWTTMRRVSETQLAVHAVRIPVERTRTGIEASTDPAEGFFDGIVHLDVAPTNDHELSRERPASAVNGDGDWLIAYGRWSTVGDPPVLPEVRYAVWYADEDEPRWSRLLRGGDGQPAMNGNPISYQSALHYATAVVDPVDDESFWIAHGYGTSTGHRFVIGSVTP